MNCVTLFLVAWDKRQTRFNLKKFFDNPRDIDVVLWAHGIAASDYLEEGDVSAPATWSRFKRVFDGDLFGFAA